MAYNVLEQIRARVDGLLGEQPYTVDEQVVSAPEGFRYPSPVYQWNNPFGVPGSAPMFSQEEMKLILIGVFFILALALVTRK